MLFQPHELDRKLTRNSLVSGWSWSVLLMGASVCRSLLSRQSRPLMGGDDSLDGPDIQEDIAQFPYVEFTGRDSITCPTCQGSGRIPSGQMNELVALIPYSDQRLRPRRTKLYVVLSVILCLLASFLVAFFLFPRPVLVIDDGIRSVTVHFDRNNSKVLINMTSSLNFSNSNFFTVWVDSVSCQVLYMKDRISTAGQHHPHSASQPETGQLHCQHGDWRKSLLRLCLLHHGKHQGPQHCGVHADLCENLLPGAGGTEHAGSLPLHRLWHQLHHPPALRTGVV
uniref:Transmembrane protein 106C n=1 Tax=Cyprinus carpio carpio TaxID=630221 RepID=A0A9J8B5Y3_CYPCA